MLSEKIYLLRKKRGLSQEQLASELHVSRQAISKWESGSSMPESEKLIALSKYFQVSIDDLIKDEDQNTLEQELSSNVQKITLMSNKKILIGLIICVAGIVGLLLWGIAFIFSPTVSNQLSESSMIQIDGNGLLLIGCVITIVIGVIILLKGNK